MVVSAATFPIPPIGVSSASLTVGRRGSTPLAPMIERFHHGQQALPS
jgi:hypothetical protein